MVWLALIAEPGLAYPSMLAPLIVAGVGVSMAIPAAQNSAVGSVAEDAIGKAAGANSMMRELGGVFGIAVAVAVFAGAGSYASRGGVHRRVRPRRSASAPGWRWPAPPPAWRCRVAGARAAATHPGGPGPRPGGHAMRQVMVRYKVKPERVAENEALVRAVYEELGRAEPDGIRYATFRLEDGVSFVHLALQTDDGPSPLTELEAFQRFAGGHPRPLRRAARRQRPAAPIGVYRL